jgi:hypothetical protein
MIFKNETGSYLSKDEVLRHHIRDAFDNTNNDFMGDINAEEIIAYARYVGYDDLADEMDFDLEMSRLNPFRISFNQ